MDKSKFNWKLYISNPLTDALVGTAVGIIKKNPVIGTAVTALSWAAGDLANRQEALWK